MGTKWVGLFTALLALNILSFGQPVMLLAAAATTPTPTAGSGLFDEIESHLSPNGQWTATLNRTTGSLELSGRRQTFQIFPEGSGARDINWSPDSTRLLVVRPYAATDPQQGTSVPQPIEIWQVRLTERHVLSTTRLFQSSPEAFEQDGVQQVVFGPWSPNSRYVVIWVGLLSASILADGLPPQLLDTETGQLYPVALDSSIQDPVYAPTRDNTALINPRYQSWSPDSSRLAITAGGYRSAQINKWLNLFDLATGQVTTVISQAEQIPGAVAWSPQGDVIAYAAVPAADTGAEWADWMSFDNPAIAGRRIYLLDPATGQYRRLNNRESYQDAPVWSPDGARLYYAQRNGKFLDLMVANPVTGQARAVPGVRQPVDLGDPMRPEVGYYGQFGREELLAEIPEALPGATATGRVVAGYGQHSPVSDLPLWVGNEPIEEIRRRTAENGAFTLTGLPPGLIRVRNSHLEFEVPVTAITETIKLGLLKYPLFHPPLYYWWTAAPLPDPALLLDRGKQVDFEICHTEPDWPRPTLQAQQAAIWTQQPFSERSSEWLNWWFERKAVLYNSEDQFEQSYPTGPNLDLLTADWRYLLGLWTDHNFKFATNDTALLVPQTACSYDSEDLEALLLRRQLELWLIGYRAHKVQRLDKAEAGYDQVNLCHPEEVTCVERPGHHFAVQVAPASGYQIIRFAGVEDVLAVHLVDDQGQELATLPELQPDRWPK